jgi:hypothetical protein
VTGCFLWNFESVPVKQNKKKFNPDEIRATETSLGRLGRRDKFGRFGFGMDSILCLFIN